MGLKEILRDQPFSRKLTWINMAVSATAVLLACVLFVVFDVSTFRQNIARYASSQAEMIGSNSASALVFDDPPTAQRTVSTLSAAPNVTYAAVYTNDGQRFASYSRSGSEPAPPPPSVPVGELEAYRLDEGHISLARRILVDGTPAGLAYVRISTATLNARLRLYASVSAAVLVLSLLAALLVSSVFKRAVVERIVHLAEVAQAVSREKHFSLRATTDGGRNEVSILVDAFNEMLAQLQARDFALHQVQADLEARVEERTTQLKRQENNLRVLSGRLMALQDEERRRIARELHDSTGQVLAAFAMNLALLQRETEQLSPNASKALNECLEMVKNLSRELRTLSYLLHPPLLDEAGLGSALQWYVQGFSERSGIRANLELSPDLGRLPHDLEIAIFRIVQESLTNVHRHSGSDVTTVRIMRDAATVRAEVSDRGKGFAVAGNHQGVKPGVGVQGMRERVSQLGGDFEIVSGDHGTIVVVTFPIPKPPPETSTDTSVPTETARQTG